jgi:UDP-glucose 4-epimerase
LFIEFGAQLRIVVTGVAGLFGSNFVRSLLSKGHNVIGIDNLSGGYKDFVPNNNKNFKFIKGNTKDTKLIKKIFEKFEPDTCYHFAAYAAEGLSPFIRKYNYENNVLGSIPIINECIKSNTKLIFTSSMAVYGSQATPFTEDMVPSPIDPYGVAKFTVEQDIILGAEQFDLKYNIIRPHNVIGIYQNIWDRYRNVCGIFIRNSIQKKPLVIFGDGSQKRAFSDIEMYMEPLIQMADNYDNQIFNIGSNHVSSILQIAEIVCDVSRQFGIESKIVHQEKRHEAKDAFCSHNKFESVFGSKDEKTVKELIYKMYVWALGQKNRKIKDMTYEIEKGIYSYWK